MNQYEILKKYYGYQSFREGQETLIGGVMNGRDVLGIMPTGGGKSLCYQIPALLLEGTTVVVSPLISLMQDQVMALKSMGIPAAYLNSTLSYPQLQAVYRNLLAGQYKILYVAPERLETEGFGAVAARLNIPFVAVDESHCISQWGQDFRPSYLRILNFVNSLPQRPVVGAYTATATAQVRKDIEQILELRHPVRVVTGFDRPNLYFDVLTPEFKDPELKSLLHKWADRSGIVYCSTRSRVERVCEMLCDDGIPAVRYHAGLSEEERSANQEDFLFDRKRVMVATNAFGMGIDKSNVGYVVHYNMPRSLEAYYQEAGRAGRDGAEADCVILYNRSDVVTARYLIENGADNENLTPQQQAVVRKQDYARLEAMNGYCTTRTCLRGYILEYFGEKHPEICGKCGTCRGNFELKDITRESQMILSCIKRIYDQLHHSVSVALVSRVLQGSRERPVLEQGLDKLSTYGLMKQTGRTAIGQMVQQLESDGCLITDPKSQMLLLRPPAAEVLYHGKAVQMRVRKEKELFRSGAGEKNYPRELYERLEEVREAVARETGVPAYSVFTDVCLKEMARKRPTTRSQFKKISGVGEIRAAWHGDRFLGVIRSYLAEENNETT